MADPKRVGFEALVQEVKIKSLRTGDRSVRITLEVDAPSDDLLKGLVELQRADQMVAVGIAESYE